MTTLNDALDELSFLTRSSTRARLLRELRHSSPVDRQELREQFDCDRTTLQRNLDALDEHGWVEQTNHTVQITQAGELMAAGVAACTDTAATAMDLQPLLRWVPDDELDFDLDLLNDADIAVADSRHPDRAVCKHIDALQAADRFRGFIPSIGRHALEVAWRRVTNNECSFEVIIPREGVNGLEPGTKSAEMFDDLLHSDSIEVLVTDEDVPYYLGIVDEVVQIGIEDDAGMRGALLETEQPQVRAWAVDTYRTYKRQASMLEHRRSRDPDPVI